MKDGNGNELDDTGMHWHLWLTLHRVKESMLEKAAWNVQERGKAGIVHRHKKGDQCNQECEVVSPNDMKEEEHE